MTAPGGVEWDCGTSGVSGDILFLLAHLGTNHSLFSSVPAFAGLVNSGLSSSKGACLVWVVSASPGNPLCTEVPSRAPGQAQLPSANVTANCRLSVTADLLQHLSLKLQFVQTKQ
jgi:hypothetical protein